MKVLRAPGTAKLAKGASAIWRPRIAFAPVAVGMSELEIGRVVIPALCARTDVIEGRPLLFPDGGMRDVEASAWHGLATDGAAAFLS